METAVTMYQSAKPAKAVTKANPILLAIFSVLVSCFVIWFFGWLDYYKLFFSWIRASDDDELSSAAVFELDGQDPDPVLCLDQLLCYLEVGRLHCGHNFY
jgi:hypothetical protein